MAPLTGSSDNPNQPAVLGESTAAGGIGVKGFCATGHGVRGESTSSKGVVGTSKTYQGVYGHSEGNAGVVGESDKLHGVFGVCHNPNGAGTYGTNDKGGFGLLGESTADGGVGVQGTSVTGHGVRGESTSSKGVVGTSKTYQGVYGHSEANAGVVGESDQMHGVFGVCHNPNGGGVFGTNDAGGHGVEGYSQTGRGVWGHSESEGGVVGETNSAVVAAVAGFNNNPQGTGAAIYGEKQGNVGHAGFFKGNVHVTGILSTDADILLTNADCAEDFDVADAELIEPGTVMVLGDEGALHESCQPYDKRVAGVVSGAGECKPGIVLDKRQSQSNRKPIALLGKVFCKVDAQYDAVEVGDLLTTSPTRGHAMKTSDPSKAFGAVIGKALRPLGRGERGLIPILIALQ